MLIAYAYNWWALVVRGIAALIFGLLAFVWPGITLLSLIFIFGAYALADGIFAIVAGLRAPKEFKRWWLLLIEGILSVIAGVMAFFWPGVTGLILLGLIAGWAIGTGIIEIVAAIQMRKQITGEWLMILSGLLSVLFGALLLINPAGGALAVVLIIGAYAVVFGILQIALGVKLRGLERASHPMSPKHA